MSRVGRIGRVGIGEYAGGFALAYENAIASQDPALAQVVAENNRGDFTAALLTTLNQAALNESQRRLLETQLQYARQGVMPPPPRSAWPFTREQTIGAAFAIAALLAVWKLSRGR
jgi:hypothetical protein